MDAGNPYAAPRSDAGPQTIPDLPLASAGARFLARFLDGLLEMSPVIVGAVIFIAGARGMQPDQPPAPGQLAPLLLGYVAAFGIWLYQTIRLIRTGQTLGKKWAGVRVVSLGGQPPTFGSHFLRGLVFNLLGLISALFIFRNDRRCLHDLAGETRVITVQ